MKSGTAGGESQTPVRSIDILLDRASSEAFVNHGEVSSSRCELPRESGLWMKAENGPVLIKSLMLYPLKPAWTAAR